MGPIYNSLGIVFYDIPTFFERLLNLPKNLITPITVLIILLGGVSLFYFRKRYRLSYGISECALGLIIGVEKTTEQNIDNFASYDFYLVILTASLFLVVRGFDNIYHALTKEPLNPFLEKINFAIKRIEELNKKP